ncbi:RIIa domain-containing protein 1 isoform X2 [Sphaerodactylus townsendi]|uniref:RIIa domain-containing protein 1 isoform X2 n=1 Tax=Sphaerodactylus townsendi TaxID=933632 RepID=UPI0020275929|nr:RIIa domain-containing protein 1 isoform X2 [Sphaerodactylus townsendi]XP_048339516.1 RIIa domain-containing protein 1 isoform X2 [Sphaerodactylus townsendi]
MDTLGSGLEISNAGALSGSQKMELMEFKINTKIENEKYLRSHKEVELLLAGFLRSVLLQRPENIQEFAADYFTNPDLPEKIQQQLMEKMNQAV